MALFEFGIGENKMFVSLWGLKLYSWLAKRKGYNVAIHDYGAWYEALGGRYEVKLTNATDKKPTTTWTADSNMTEF